MKRWLLLELQPNAEWWIVATFFNAEDAEKAYQEMTSKYLCAYAIQEVAV